jgi:hypothetical protein
MSEPTPCATYPSDDEVEVKTVGLGTCPDCGAHECWLHYLRWEVRAGVTLNARYYHLVIK